MKGCAKAAEVLRCTPSQGHSRWLAGVARDAASELPLGEKNKRKKLLPGVWMLGYKSSSPMEVEIAHPARPGRRRPGS